MLKCGDCLELIKEIQDNSIDCILTSPPYNFDIEYNSYEDKKDIDSYFSWLNSIFGECYRVLKDDGRLIINIQPLFSKYIPTHHILSNNLTDIGFKWKAEFIWDKNNYNCAYTTWGSWKSPSSPYIKYTWEFVEVFCKNEYKKIGDSENIDITAEEFKEYTTANGCRNYRCSL